MTALQITWFLNWKADLDFRPLALETAYGDNASQLLYDAPPETLLASHYFSLYRRDLHDGKPKANSRGEGVVLRKRSIQPVLKVFV